MSAAACSPQHEPARSAGALAGVTLRVWRYKGAASHFMAAAGLGDFPYKVEFADFGGGALVLNALAADALDYAHMSQVPPIFAAQFGVPLRFVAAHLGDVNNSGLLVRKDAAVRDVSDLKGKSVSFVRATNNHYELLKILQAHGLSFADIKPVPLSVQDGMAAFSQGHVDAIMGSGVTALLALEQYGARWLVGSVAGYYSGNFLIATTPRVLADAGKHAALADYLRREKQTWDWIGSHPDAWAETSARITGAPKRLFLRLQQERSRLDRLTPVTPEIIHDQQAVADDLRRAGLVERAVDLAPLWTNEFSSSLV